MGKQTVAKQKRSEALIERDIAIYKRQMRGLSVRALCEEFGLKSTQSVHIAIQRGREYAKTQGIDVEARRIEINELFEETLLEAVQQLREQRQHGQEVFFVDQDGNKSMKRTKGADVRLIGEIGRSLHRWSEFLGLMDRAPEQNVQATTVVLTAPAAGAEFESRYANMPSASADDQALAAGAATPVQAQVLSEGGPGWGAPPAGEGEQAAA